jgi:hypothetical protein
MLPGRCARNRPGTPAARSVAAASAGRIVLPDGPASIRGRHHPTAGIFGGMQASDGPGGNPPVRPAADGNHPGIKAFG